MAADDFWSSDGRSGDGQRPAGAPPPRPARQPASPIRRDPAPSPEAGMEEAIARLAAQILAPAQSPSAPDKKFRFDFRSHRTKPDEEAGVAPRPREADRAQWAGSGPVLDDAPPGETIDTQLEAIRQRLAELARTDASPAPVATELPERRSRDFALEPPAPSHRPAPDSAPNGLAVIENHLARLAGEIAVLSQRRAPADPEVLARLTEIREFIAAGCAREDIARLERRIATLGDRMEAVLQRTAPPERLGELAARIDAAATGIEEIASRQNRPLQALDTLTREVATLRRDMATALRRPDAALEAQVSALAGRIDALGRNAVSAPALAKLEAEVARLSGRLSDPMPARPAPAAAGNPPATADAGAESLLITALKEDLLRLQAGRRAGGAAAAGTARERTSGSSSAEARPGPDAGAPPRPALADSIEENRPLAPGSGRPLPRGGAGGRKAEFVAAARRAAMVAAAEMPSLPSSAPHSRAPWRLREAVRPATVGIAAGVVAVVLGAFLTSARLAPAPPGEAIAHLSDRQPLAAAPVPLPEQAEGEEAPAESPALEAAPAPFSPEADPSVAGLAFGPSAPSAEELTAATPLRPATPEDQITIRPVEPIPPPPAAIGPAQLRSDAAAGDPAALFEIAVRYAEGRGVPADAAAAAKWYALAADRGLAVAQFRIASLYERGEGVTKDRAKAAEWYRRAAEQGNVRAMHNLAVMLSEGAGGPPDLAAAAQWFATAADHGVRDSQYNLGVMYARGLGGPQDLVQSYKWFSIAAQQGDPDAATRRDEVGKALSPDQLAQAQAAIRAWRAREPSAEANNPPVPDDQWQTPQGRVSSLDRPALVRLIQARLAELGFDPGPADGQEGPMTRQAVAAFQRQNGVPTTGTIGPELLAALDVAAQ